MKLILCLTFLALASIANSAYVPIPISTFEQDLSNFELLNFGVDKLIAAARYVSKLTENPFDITRIRNVSLSQSTTSDYYRYQVDLDDSKGTTITTTFTILVKNDTPQSMVSYYYNIWTYNYADLGVDYLIPENDYNDTVIQECMQWGIDYVVSQGIEQGKISATEDFAVSEINSVYSEPSGDQVKYKYNIQLENADGSYKIATTFTVSRNNNTGKMRVMFYRYAVTDYY